MLIQTSSTRLRFVIPWLLLSIRLLITPLFLILPDSLGDPALLWLYLLAFVTDYLDGRIARALGTATRKLRMADSAADVVFHLALAYVLFRHHADVFRNSAAALILFCATAAAWYLLDLIRWRRVAGFHCLSAKLFSVAIMAWIVLLLSGVHPGWLFSIVLIVGSISNIEGIAISLILRRDRVDVWWVGAAWDRPGFEPMTTGPASEVDAPAPPATMPFDNPKPGAMV